MFRRFPPPSARALGTLGASAGAGALGCLPGAAGAFDPVTLCGWLALSAPAAGALVGSSRAPFFPFGLCVPGSWVLLLVLVEARAGGGLPSPLWAACALAGLFGLGFALGRRLAAPLAGAGLVAFATLWLASAPVGLGLVASGSELARSRPALAARLLDLSPLVLAFDCAGHDWTHAQPELYALAGVEWFQRRPYRGELAGPALLMVGCLLAALVRLPRQALDEP